MAQQERRFQVQYKLNDNMRMAGAPVEWCNGGFPISEADLRAKVEKNPEQWRTRGGQFRAVELVPVTITVQRTISVEIERNSPFAG